MNRRASPQGDRSLCTDVDADVRPTPSGRVLRYWVPSPELLVLAQEYEGRVSKPIAGSESLLVEQISRREDVHPRRKRWTQ